MHPTLTPALACAVTAMLAGACGLMYVGKDSDDRPRIVLTAIFACIVAMGGAGIVMLMLLPF